VQNSGINYRYLFKEFKINITALKQYFAYDNGSLLLDFIMYPDSAYCQSDLLAARRVAKKTS